MGPVSATTDLPKDLKVSPGPVADVDELWAFTSSTAVAQSGRTNFSRDMLDSWLTMPNFDQKTSMRLVRNSHGELVAAAWIDNRAPHIQSYAGGFVAPDLLGRGIGSYLLEWARAEAVDRIPKAPDGARVSFGAEVYPDHEPSVALLTDAGLDLVRYFLEMRIDLGDAPAAAVLPEGIRFEPFDFDRDLEPLFDSSKEAFRDHFGHVERPRDEDLEWFSRFLEMPSVDRDRVYIAMDGDEIAGSTICFNEFEGDDSVAYVASLSVRRPWRGRGLAKAMLQASFADFADDGKRAVTLHVDGENITGAKRLYESVGMRETHRMAWYEVELRPGEELSVR
jgi:ribosomal protein S18 acetylase RimI-like enzyme